MINYEEKYLKYKTKYLELKNSIGGKDEPKKGFPGKSFSSLDKKQIRKFITYNILLFHKLQTGEFYTYDMCIKEFCNYSFIKNSCIKKNCNEEDIDIYNNNWMKDYNYKYIINPENKNKPWSEEDLKNPNLYEN